MFIFYSFAEINLKFTIVFPVINWYRVVSDMLMHVN